MYVYIPYTLVPPDPLATIRDVLLIAIMANPRARYFKGGLDTVNFPETLRSGGKARCIAKAQCRQTNADSAMRKLLVLCFEILR